MPRTTDAARAAARLKFKSKQIFSLKSQIRGYHLNLQKANTTIERLEAQLAALNEEKASMTLIKSPTDQILADIQQNARRKPQGRRYSLETLTWGSRIHTMCPAAWKAVRKVLPVPGKRLFLAKFTKYAGISDALIDATQMDELIDLWRQAVPPGTAGPVVLSVDAVAFRPLITVDEEGHVDGLKTTNELATPDLFSQFVSDPGAFVEFVKEHWDDAYTALFAFQLQPLDPDLPCSIIHTMPATDGKANRHVVDRLLDIKEVLEHQFGFSVVGLAFDGDSAFNGLHDEFRALWVPRVPVDSPAVPADVELPVVICDPLHLLKRIRYRWVSARLSIGFGGDTTSSFSTETIQSWKLLPNVVFLNTRITKMHDSLPLRLFSPVIFGRILKECGASPRTSELVLTPWCMLTAALTLPSYSTATRIDLLEIGFWYLYLYDERLRELGLPPGVSQNLGEGHVASLYTEQQMRDGLNTFVALIVLLRRALATLRMNRIGTGPLEHAFGRGRISCRDVNTMKRLIGAFAAETISLAIDAFLQLMAEPRRRASIGVDCEPLSQSGPSIFTLPPKEIAMSLLGRTGFGPLPLPDQPQINPPWKQLLRITYFLPYDPWDVRPKFRLSPERKASVKVLSSNQIFLGVISTPRPLHMIMVPEKMGQALAPHLAQVLSWLDGMFGRRLTAHDIEQRVQSIAPRIRAPPPLDRKRDSYLQWLHDNWGTAAPALRELAAGT